MNSRFNIGWDHLRRAWGGFLGATGKTSLPKVSADLSPPDAEKVKLLMEDCVARRGGEVTARQRAAVLGRLYLTLSETGQMNFLELLIDNFSVDRDQVLNDARKMLASTDENHFLMSSGLLRESLVSPRIRLLRQFNALPQGIKFLVDLRADVLSFRKIRPKIASLDRELKDLLISWFDIGFLSVARITWQSPAALLEKLIAYEAVHAINSWNDLHNRLESDRRCYAFFHPGMSDEPLIFIEVALVEGLATNIQELLDEKAPEIDPMEANTAIFYSISNTQRGLQGISFGPFLIKQVVTELQQQLPNLKTFSTLSPLPGFRRWLTSYVEEARSYKIKTPIMEALQQVASLLNVEANPEEIFNNSDWWQNPQTSEALREPLLSLCARYLHERREKDQTPIDPVARFHLGNGARLERINWLGDTSSKGLEESCGLMVNYLYHLKEIEQNIEAYTHRKMIITSNQVRNLLREDDEEQGHLQRLRRRLSLKRISGSNHSNIP